MTVDHFMHFEHPTMSTNIGVHMATPYSSDIYIINSILRVLTIPTLCGTKSAQTL